MPDDDSSLRRWSRVEGPKELLRTGPVAAHVSTWENGAKSHRLQALEVRAGDWCNVVAVTEDDHVVLVRQFRFGIEDFSLETPGGVVDEGESAEEAAARELFEETGFRGDAPERLTRVYPNPALQRNVAHGFLVQNARFVGGHRGDDGEEIEVVRMPVTALDEMLSRGAIHHALIVVTLQAYLAKRRKAP